MFHKVLVPANTAESQYFLEVVNYSLSGQTLILIKDKRMIIICSAYPSLAYAGQRISVFFMLSTLTIMTVDLNTIYIIWP